MKHFAVLILLALFVSVVNAQTGVPGRIVNTSTTEAQAVNSMADWYTMKAEHISGEAGNVVVATKWGATYILKGFYNTCHDSAVYVKVRTQQLDTVTFAIAALTASGKLPPMDMIFKTGTSDSLIYFFQRY